MMNFNKWENNGMKRIYSKTKCAGGTAWFEEGRRGELVMKTSCGYSDKVESALRERFYEEFDFEKTTSDVTFNDMWDMI